MAFLLKDTRSLFGQPNWGMALEAQGGLVTCWTFLVEPVFLKDEVHGSPPSKTSTDLPRTSSGSTSDVASPYQTAPSGSENRSRRINCVSMAGSNDFSEMNKLTREYAKESKDLIEASTIGILSSHH